jgi:hypothetical protein
MRRVQPNPLYIALDFDGVLHHCSGGPSSKDFDVLKQKGRRAFVQKIEGEYPREVQKPDKTDQLTPEGRLFDRERRLRELLRKVPKANIVIATSWRQHVRAKKLGAFLSPTVRKRIVGVLDWDPTERTSSGVRGRLMDKWLRKRRLHGSSWIALDDQAHHYTKHMGRLVQTDWWGLNRKCMNKATRALTRCTVAPVARK